MRGNGEVEGALENPIEHITVKFKDGTTRTIESGYLLALEDETGEGETGFAAYMMVEEDPHAYLDLIYTLGQVQSQLSEVAHNLLHGGEEAE